MRVRWDKHVVEARPSWQNAVPLVAVAVVALVSALLSLHEGQAPELILAGLMFAAALATLAVSVHRARRTWIDPVPVYIAFPFVAASHYSSVDRTILRSIVGIARDLGKQTVAEFVTEPAILDVVREEGVDHAQGYLIGEPLSYDDFVAEFMQPA